MCSYVYISSYIFMYIIHIYIVLLSWMCIAHVEHMHYKCYTMDFAQADANIIALLMQYMTSW